MTTRRFFALGSLCAAFLRPATTTAASTSTALALGGFKMYSTAGGSAMEQQRQFYRTDEQWRSQLSPEEYNTLREKGTEYPGTGEYDSHYPKKGVYRCRGCETPLYTAEDKFKSGCGWPAFDNGFKGAIERHVDNTFGMKRIEIVCKACGGHLGHVFEGEGFTPTNERHCVNSLSLRFDPDGDMSGAKDV